jgi:hypothetical protein
MATWITIKVEDLYAYLVASQVDILRRVAEPKSDKILGKKLKKINLWQLG